MFARRRLKSALAGRLAVVCTLAASCLPLPAAQHWVSLTTPHFEMYTTNSPGSGAKALQIFERVRSFFLEASPSKQAPDTPVRIIAFRSEKEFTPYRPNGGALAYYQRSRKRDYIVIQDEYRKLSDRSSRIYAPDCRTCRHEIADLAERRVGRSVFVTRAERRSDDGGPPSGRKPAGADAAKVARSENLLTSVQQNSPYYNQRDKMAIFYAQSWALTHMLVLGKNYHAGFSRFVASVSAGNSAEASFASVYGKTLGQVRADLNRYFQQTTVQVSLFDIKMEKINLPLVADLTPLSIELALTDLLASQPSKAGEAKRRLDGLAAEYPENAEIEESLGYFTWQAGDSKAAAAHFGNAAAKGIDDPEMLYHYATLIGQQHDKLELKHRRTEESAHTETRIPGSPLLSRTSRA